MKKLFCLLILISITAISVVGVQAVVTDKEHGIIYYMWSNSSDNISGGEPLNWLALDYGEIEGESGIILQYDKGQEPYDPYYSMTKVRFDEYKYCSIRTYFKSPENRENVKSSILVRFAGGGSEGLLYRDIDCPANKWITQTVSFKKEDGASCEWADEGAEVTWFRLNAKVKEGESLYIKWIAFFKTKAEADAFNGFADKTLYNDLLIKAQAINKNNYSNYSKLQDAMNIDVSDAFYIQDQYRIDNAVKAIQEAIDNLIAFEETEFDGNRPDITLIKGEELELSVTSDDTESSSEFQTEISTETETEAETEAVTGTSEESDTLPDDKSEENDNRSGCGGVTPVFPAIVFTFAVFSIRRKRK